MSDLNPREREIFSEALELNSPEERRAFVRGACGDNATLREAVESLLAAYSAADSFIPTRALEAPSLRRNASEKEQPGDRIGRYKLLEQIGEGGCGVVYVAEQEEPVRRRVALKVIKLGMDTRSVIARFEAERQALALMDHPNIAKVLDAGATDTGGPFFVMELVRGIRITEYCDQNNLSTHERLDLFIQVCHAIQHAHQKGIIHRDIKPSNILVTLHDGVPVPKVIDFGIAKATNQQRLTDKTLYTAFEQVIGTPAYMSPEQAEMSGLDIDTRSDIYALGVLLYELLTSKTPFDTKTLMAAGLNEMRRIIREQEPVRPSTRLGAMVEEELTTTAQHRHVEPPKLVHLLQGDLDWIVMKALEKDRTRRYETANGMALDIERHMKHEPVLARSPSTAYRMQKFVRRNKLMVWATAGIAAALVLGTVVSTWQALKTSKANRAEKAQRFAAVAALQEAERSQQAEQQARLRADHLLYVANLNLAQQAWDQNNLGRLRQLLEDTRESPDRGFEWFYWQRQTRLAIKTLRGHLEAVASVAFSPDGQRLVTGSYDGTAKVWEVVSGRQLVTFERHSAPITSAAFSPDGRQIVTGSGDQSARVWEAASGREVLTLKGHSAPIIAVAFSPDGQRIITGSADATARIWEAASGKELRTLKGHKAQINSLAYAPDGQRIVTGSFDNTARVWETVSGREVFTITGHSNWVWSVAYAPDGQRIVTGSYDNTAKVWEAASGRELVTFKGHKGGLWSVAFSPDGQWVVSGSWDQTARVWEAASGRELLTLKGHTAFLKSVAFSPDGQFIVTSAGDRTAKVWKVASGGPRTLQEHGSIIGSVAYSPDGQRIVTGGTDATAKVWEAASGRRLLSLQGHSAPVNRAAFSPDGQRILTASDDATAKVWEAASGRELLTLKGHSAPISSVAFSLDGRRILTGGADTTARIWEAATGQALLTLTGHTARVWSASFSPDGQRIVTGSHDATAKVWAADSGRILLTLTGHTAGVWPAAFSPDGQRIATGSDDATAKVWEAASGRELLTLRGHASGINSLMFFPDGQRILTGSDDATAKVWDLVSGRELLTLQDSAPIGVAAFSPVTQQIVTAGVDPTARIWEAASAEQVATWESEERVAAQALATFQRERSAELERQRLIRARDSIKQWLVLAPIPLGVGQSGTEGLDLEQLQGEAKLMPKRGEAVSVGGGELNWREVALTNEVLDFNGILGQVTTQSVAYAACYLRSAAAHGGLRMLVGSDDEAKIYLNGQEVYKSSFPHSFFAELEEVPGLALQAGLNVLVLKVVNEVFDWKGAIRFTGVEGNPVEGVQVTLDPAPP